MIAGYEDVAKRLELNWTRGRVPLSAVDDERINDVYGRIGEHPRDTAPRPCSGGHMG